MVMARSEWKVSACKASGKVFCGRENGTNCREELFTIQCWNCSSTQCPVRAFKTKTQTEWRMLCTIDWIHCFFSPHRVLQSPEIKREQTYDQGCLFVLLSTDCLWKSQISRLCDVNFRNLRYSVPACCSPCWCTTLMYKLFGGWTAKGGYSLFEFSHSNTWSGLIKIYQMWYCCVLMFSALHGMDTGPYINRLIGNSANSLNQCIIIINSSFWASWKFVGKFLSGK